VLSLFPGSSSAYIPLDPLLFIAVLRGGDIGAIAPATLRCAPSVVGWVSWSNGATDEGNRFDSQCPNSH